MNINASLILDHNNSVKKFLDSIIDTTSKGDDLLSQKYGFLPVGSKNHVVTHPQLNGWIIKGQRRDFAAALTDSNTHIYRVFQRELIQKTIDRHALKHYVVPKKFIYYHQKTGQSLVVAEMLKLKNEPVSLTKEQAREAAIICHYGRLQDVHEGNFAYVEDGRIALPDTEPLDMKLFLTVKSKGLFLFPWYLRTVSYISSSTNATRLKNMCKDKEGIREIEKIERRIFLEELSILITKIVLPLIIAVAIIIYAINPILWAVGIGLTVVTSINGLVGLLPLTLTIDNYLCKRFLINRYICPGIND